MEELISKAETDELERLLELLQRHCLLGQSHFRMWRLLNRGFAETPEVGNLAPTFFVMTAEAHLNSALLILNRLIDNRRDSLSIRRFLERADALATGFPHSTPVLVREAVARDLAMLSADDATAKRIRDHRNEQFIHLSRDFLQRDVTVAPADDGFAYEDIYRILQSVGVILNRYLGFLRRSEMAMEFGHEKDDCEYIQHLLLEVARKEWGGGSATPDVV